MMTRGCVCLLPKVPACVSRRVPSRPGHHPRLPATSIAIYQCGLPSGFTDLVEGGIWVRKSKRTKKQGPGQASGFAKLVGLGPVGLWRCIWLAAPLTGRAGLCKDSAGAQVVGTVAYCASKPIPLAGGLYRLAGPGAWRVLILAGPSRSQLSCVA